MFALFQHRLDGLWPVSACSLLALSVAFGLSQLLRGRLTALSPSRRSLLTDLGYLVFGPVTETLTRLLTTSAIALAAVALGREVAPALTAGFGPVMRQPRPLIILEMLVLGDLIYYWTHRAAHAWPLLFRFHAVHHSTEHMRFTSALRSHPGEAYVIVVNHLPLCLLGFPVDALLAAAPLTTLYAMLIHCPWSWSFRPLSYVLNSPLFHGWHHARDVREGTKNYAGLFPVFDVIFGTYHLPHARPAETGIEDGDMPADFAGQLVHPWRSGPGEPSMPHVRGLSAAE